MSARRFVWRLISGVALCAMVASQARTEEASYSGKRLSLLINFAAGGPTDIEGRLFAKHLAKHIAGHPNIIVQNMDGAGGVVGAAYLGEVAPRDGSMIGFLSGVSWIYVNEPQRWRVDFKNYRFISYQTGTTVHFVRTDVPPGMKSPADIVKAQGVVAGGLSADQSKDLRMRLGLDMLGVPFKYVTGYRSDAPARLALQRGEINLFSESPPSYRNLIEPQLVKNGQVIPLWFDSSDTAIPPKPQKQLEGLTIMSFPQLHMQVKGALPSGQLWEAYRTVFSINSTLQRMIVAPPETPQSLVNVLRDAIGKLNNDQEYAAEALTTLKFVPEYATGPDVGKRVREILSATPEIKAFVTNYIAKR